MRAGLAKESKSSEHALSLTVTKQDQNDWILVTKKRKHRTPRHMKHEAMNKSIVSTKIKRAVMTYEREAKTASREGKVIARRAQSSLRNG